MNRGFPVVDLKAHSDWVERVREILAQQGKVLLQNYQATEDNNFKVINLAMQERLLIRIEAGSFILEKRNLNTD